MFYRRGPNASGTRFLVARLWIFAIGAVLAVVGMVLGNDWIVWVAAAVLVSGVILRLVASRAPDDTDPSDLEP